jgi:HPt (histidine-containing phosphotransfer) domain-containing protein
VTEEAASARALDPGILDRLERELGGSRARLAAVLSVYLEEVEPYLADVRQAFENGDADRMEFAAHRLGSASVMVGATRLTDLCRELESVKDATEGAAVGELVAQIEAESEAVNAAIRDILE